MAKKAAKTEQKKPAGRKALAGKRVAFVGKFTYPQDKHKVDWLNDAGGKLASPEDEIDFLVYGEGRGGNPPGEVAKIEKRLPSVVSLSVAEFAQMVLPTPD